MTTTINFNDLARGTIVDNEYQAQGVLISAFGGCDLAMIFDTSNPTGGDHDLATNNLGNVLIISEDGDQHDPDDNASGGTLSFTFDEPSRVEELTFLDIEEGAFVCFYDIDGNLISQQHIGTTANNGQKVLHFDVENVARMDVLLHGSGAIDNLKFDTPEAMTGPDGVVEGTDGADVIDVNYTGDPNGDRIDANDALLPGEGPQDDIVLAGGGNDRVYAGEGNDDIRGGDGNDQLFGQAGNDTIYGEDGDDMLFGGDGDDVLRGGNGDDKIEASQGDDCVEGGAGNDDLWGGKGNDVIDGGEGNDTINAGSGNDTVYGGSGDDDILGGDGQDVIYGDSSKPGANGGEVIRESFEWDLVNSNLPQNFTQDTGNAKVTFNTLQETGHSDTKVGTDLQNVSGIDDGGEGIDHCSSLDNVLNGQGNEADYRLSFDKPVYNVDFRINDIDGDGVVKVTAYDADGNKIPVLLDGGDRLTLLDTDEIAGADTADSQGGYLPDTSAEYSLLVNIPGPVARIEIEHDQNGVNNSGINITDIYFDVPTADMGPDGDDVINAGAGADIVFGEGGDDVIDGGAGADQISGGADSDRIIGGVGDTVDGGAGGNDFDILDLTGQGPFYLDNVENDSNGNGINGTVVFVDEDGVPTGGTIVFTEIEEVRGDNVGRPPEANDDTATVDEDGSVTIPVLDNDSDPDGDPLEVVDATSPNGTVTINPDGTITFEPDENFNGETTITYTVTDPDGNTDTATVTVNVTPVNDDPVANDDTATTDEDTPVTIPVLNNDTDVDGDALEVVSATSPDGTVEINDDGTITFTPNPDFSGETTIEYTVSDGNGGTDTATVTVNVTPVDDAPIAQDDTAETDEDTPVTIDVLDNDSDPDGDPLEVVDATSPNGDVTINDDGTVTFTPDENFNGETTITYTVTDPDGNTDTATVTVNVAPVNDGPVAEDDDASTPEDTPVKIAVLDNDSDPDGDLLDVVAATSPDGTVEINDDGTITFTPNPGFVGEATINYTIEDPDGAQDSAQVTITVTNVNERPDAVDDTASGVSGTPVVINALVNDTDPDGDPLTITGATVPSDQGTVDVVDNQVVFTPAADFEGVAEISYTITDPDGLTDTAVITVNVQNGIVNGTDGNDVIDVNYLGDPGGDRVDNNDEILPGEGPNDDIILAGAGDDIVIAGDGDDEVYGGSGNDDITTGDGSDEVYGGSGDDVIDTDNGSFLIDKGYPGVFPGEEGTDGVFDDRDFVDGGEGNDTIRTGDDADTILGGSGNDNINAGIDDDTVDGGSGNDRIVGGEGNDTIDGGAGDDTIYAGNDPDLGLDEFDIEDDGSNPLGPDLRPDNGQDVVRGGEGNDTIFGADDDDRLFGDEGNDFIDGQIDDDYIDGGTGDDTLLGGQGDDTILGGSGNDDIDGGTGDDDLSGGDDRDTFTNVNAGDVVDGGSGGDDYDVLDLTGSAPDGGSLRVDITGPDSNGNGFDGTVTYFDEDGNETGSIDFTEIEEIIPCFTPGTMIATPQGEVAVEELEVGDKVITRDNGIQEIRWVGHRDMKGAELERAPHLKPVMIRQGALGNGLPERDMMVSPNHRMLVANDKTALYFEESEVLVAAKHLTGLEGVEVVDVNWTTYVHVMFDQHEVILSDGTWSESFQPGDQTLDAMGNAQRNEIFELFPELKTRDGIEGYISARRSLKKHEARLLMQ